jgi:hypothetical protein
MQSGIGGPTPKPNHAGDPMMTNKQRMFLMELWRKACEAMGWDYRNEELRHEMYCSILGHPKRFKDFTQQDFDQVKAQFINLAEGGDLNAQLAIDNPHLGDRKRLLWKIQKEQMVILEAYEVDAHAYVQSIIRDQFRITQGLSSLEDLSNQQLTFLRSTLAARINEIRKDVGDTVREMMLRAGIWRKPKTLKVALDVKMPVTVPENPF